MTPAVTSSGGLDIPASANAGSCAVGMERYVAGAAIASHRIIAQEAPVALVHQATTAVMMATPADLEDFAVGFALTEGVISAVADIEGLSVVKAALGWEARMWLAADRAQGLVSRRRHFAGPTGCGLCGIESLEAVVRVLPKVPCDFVMTADQVHAALDALPERQLLGGLTRAVHAAAWWEPQTGLTSIREDVGRHNALDKLVGALARADGLGRPGALVLTSRVSVEMVQKAAFLGAQVLIAISAPTALAIATARACGMSLVGVARRDAFEVFTGSGRIQMV
jgi:FdhD protein